jgi:glutaminyl-tRNA synthetase
MRRGGFEDGTYVLRAKIDMASPNMKMRDPLVYRIRKVPHHRTGDAWNIYPMYDFAHCLSDSVEGITHSLCTLEFENNRELYDWFLDALEVECHPQQIEFARLNLSHTVMSKRTLLRLVEEGHVRGWDDPRLPTLSGMRRLGYTPEAIRAFCDRIGIAKRDNLVDRSLLEYYIREDLNRRARRVMAVLRPLRVVITNYPAGKVEELEAINNPEDASAGTRAIPFSREIFIEREDFREDPPKKFFRLAPGREVRLKHAYFLKCEEVVKNESGEIVELRCTYDPATKSGSATDGRKLKGTLHWVSSAHAVEAEVRLYDTLFTEPNPAELVAEHGLENLLNPSSLEVLKGCRVEPGLANAQPGERFQFLRHGYFGVDPDTTANELVFNRTVGLRDSWAKIQKKLQPAG